jgi:hypothetical protein
VVEAVEAEAIFEAVAMTEADAADSRPLWPVDRQKAVASEPAQVVYQPSGSLQQPFFLPFAKAGSSVNGLKGHLEEIRVVYFLKTPFF